MSDSNLFRMDRDAIGVPSAVLLGLLRNLDKVHFAKLILVFHYAGDMQSLHFFESICPLIHLFVS